MRRQPSDRIESLGNDYKLWDRRWWGTRDHEKHAAELAMKASMPKEYLPVVMPMIPDHVTAFRAGHYAAVTGRQADVDRTLAQLGIGPRR